MDDLDPFPWRAVLGCAAIIAVVVLIAVSTGMCSAATPC